MYCCEHLSDNCYRIIAAMLIAVPFIRRAVVSSVEDSLIRQDYAAFDKKIFRHTRIVRKILRPRGNR